MTLWLTKNEQTVEHAAEKRVETVSKKLAKYKSERMLR
jgi:hypothetical protein